jgi:hypothetical protein
VEEDHAVIAVFSVIVRPFAGMMAEAALPPCHHQLRQIAEGLHPVSQDNGFVPDVPADGIVASPPKS